MKDLTQYLNLTPEQQFRVSAKIKRHIHEEKASVFHRYFNYGRGPGIYDRTDPENPIRVGEEPPLNPWLSSIMEAKYKQHQELAKLPDEEVITWNVGTFVMPVENRDPCSVCGADLNGKVGYTRSVAKGVQTMFCTTHSPIDEED
jgi:hypothetical protein